MKKSTNDLLLALAICGFAGAGSLATTVGAADPLEELDREQAQEDLNEAIEDVEEAEEYLEWFPEWLEIFNRPTTNPVRPERLN